MSALKLEIGRKKKGAAPSGELVLAATPAPAPASASAPKKSKGAPPALSASPRANLLPPEIGQNNSRKAVRRGLRLMIFAAVILVAIGTGGAWYLSMQAQVALTRAQDETLALSAEQASYADVQAALTGITAGEAARRVGSSTEIDWSAYLRALQATLPSDVKLTDVSIDSAGIETPYSQSTVPLEGERVATIIFSASSPSLPSIPDWINGLSSLPGFADASPGSVTRGEGDYSASVTMHINTGAFSNRFAVTEGEGE